MFVRFTQSGQDDPKPRSSYSFVGVVVLSVGRGAEVVSGRFFHPPVLFRFCVCILLPVRWYRVIIKAYTLNSTVYT